MPYKRIGKEIYSKASGQWKLKQTCKSVKNAEKALGLLKGIEQDKEAERKAKRRAPGKHMVVVK